MTRKSPDYPTIDEARQAGLILSAIEEGMPSYLRQNEDGTWYVDNEPPEPPADDEYFSW